MHPGGAATKLKADSQQEAENWLNIISASIKRVRFLRDQPYIVLLTCPLNGQAKEEEIQARLAAESALRQRAETDAAKLKEEQNTIQKDKLEIGVVKMKKLLTPK